ncbi:ISSpo8, transposase [Nitrobacter winogradskyi Nb-255]|uniref:ISSpo8, transposase n=1 Tax=Nitrobacter winogradskyi (strain ATCC 25391 / DSM 10237 / CIP 104748 / NCIMB 11846 / Nb-255) TaxID=323098 RepID=Q3SWJ2_NITWN|nr:IS1595-like element ISNwi1 family transposase [Nitrobacter winogradskyi]ABA03349.1 ISSpo8, transposase [Nitrobacter winogradskyi Nb-255]
MTDLLKNPIFQDETKARDWLEARVWANGRVCPHCGNADQEKITKLEGKAHRPGVYQCNEPACREQFTVTVGTVFERSKIPLTKWLAALFLMTASKKGVSAHQVHRMLGISYKSTWFLMHRLREAMRTGGLEPLGGEGKIVEADETYFGKADTQRVSPQRKGRTFTKNRKIKNDRPIVSLVERGGNVRSFHVAVADSSTVACIVNANVHKESRLQTDESRLYTKVGADFAAHETVNHGAKEYARGDVTTNTIESYFSVFKRGMRGTYQHCSEKHLHRYLAEFDFRYNNRIALGVNDTDRANELAKGIVGKRLTYRRPNSKDVQT